MGDWERVCGLMLDAQAVNIRQHRLLYDPSPQPDSVIELALSGEPHQAARLALEALRLNSEERERQRQVARVADRRSRSQQPIGARQAAALLRPHLEVLVELERAGVDPMRVARAAGASVAVVRRLRPGTVASRTLVKELGGRRARLVRTLADTAV